MPARADDGGAIERGPGMGGDSGFGIVSNCWRRQLADGDALDDLLEEAVRRGYRSVELRQGCLGAYETQGSHVPRADSLARLPSRFSSLRHTIAVACPFLSGRLRPESDLFRAACAGATAVAGPRSPLLRLVDPQTSTEELLASEVEAVADHLAALVAPLAEVDGVLAVEAAMQSWDAFRSVFDAARKVLGSNDWRLQLCHDPCNLVAANRVADVEPVTARLDPLDVAMVHLKQRVGEQPQTVLCPGDVDWSGQVAALNSIGYDGPRLFEVEPHLEIWDSLGESVRYLRSLSPS